MEAEFRFAQHIRSALNQGTLGLDRDVGERLHEARQRALAAHFATRHDQHASSGLLVRTLTYYRRYTVALIPVLALFVSATATYYWNEDSKSDDYAVLDSALLGDDLPPDAYLDKGFGEWLERNAASTQAAADTSLLPRNAQP